MLQERNDYLEAIRALGGDVAGRTAALEAMAASDVWAYDQPVPFSYVPYLLTPADETKLFNDMRTMHRILCKVIQHYLDDPSYRSVFGFSPELERLILMPCGYDQLLPIGRFDFFLDESDLTYKFCEFNTDGSGAASRASMISDLLQQSPSFGTFAKGRTVESYELFDSWVQAFMRIYRSDRLVDPALPHPTIALTDFEESGVHSDFRRYIAAFERAGYAARFVDVRTFAFDGEHLIDPSDNTVIHAIYRRAVTSEILQHPGECDAFLDAVEAGKVCLIGHFRTTVVHSKVVNIALFDPRTRAFLDDAEAQFVDEHVLATYLFDDSQSIVGPAEIKASKDNWILKPADDYGAHGVYPGVDFDQAAWDAIVDANYDNGYVAQQFCLPPTVGALDARIDEADPCKIEQWHSMPGIYLYDGQPVGLYCRLGKTGVIAIEHGCICACGFKVQQA